MAKRGRPPKHKPVMIVETGMIFPSYNQAAEAINGNRGVVYLCAIGMRKTHMGYHIVEVEEEC